MDRINQTQNDGNTLFPVFLKLEHLNLLIVGGGNVALEKLEAVLKNSPRTPITLVAPEVKGEIWKLNEARANINVVRRKFWDADLEGHDIVLLATDDRSLHEKIIGLTKEKNILTNVADTPDLCDFYLGSVVKKGDLKIAISTNGKSPTLAKRIKEDLNAAIPESITELLSNMHSIRQRMVGDFKEKVRLLNGITQAWLSHNKTEHLRS